MELVLRIEGTKVGGGRYDLKTKTTSKSNAELQFRVTMQLGNLCSG